MGINTNHFLTCDKHASADCPYVMSSSLDASINKIVNDATEAGWIFHKGKWLCTHCKPAIIEVFKVDIEEHGNLLVWVLSDNTVQVAHRQDDSASWGQTFYGRRSGND
jgi:hypothetical protein